ncbi:hypothetical protein YQ19_25640 [Pseudomonas aeruginosa]|nr:hypothetical protein YQ19_25640 [Pseudomonas aeruginosa]ARG49470.1 hypothetical protein BFV99_09130 [Pseudomonas aeruginosa]
MVVPRRQQLRNCIVQPLLDHHTIQPILNRGVAQRHPGIDRHRIDCAERLCTVIHGFIKHFVGSRSGNQHIVAEDHMHTAPTIEVFSRNDVVLNQIDVLPLLGAEAGVVLAGWRNPG